MGNGAEKPPQSLGAAFPSTTGWNPNGGIWGNGTIGTFGKAREVVAPKGTRTLCHDRGNTEGLPVAADSSDAFPTAPSGSGALAATSEAEPWGNRPGPWSTTEAAQTRNVSGNTSPNRSRGETTIHDTNGTAAYYSTAQPQVQPAIGQRGPARPKAGTASDSTPSTFALAAFSGLMDKDNAEGFGSSKYNAEPPGLNGFPTARRPSQDVTYQNLVGSVTRDPGMPTTSHSETDLHMQANSSFGDLSFGGHAPNSINSHRPTMSFSQSNRAYHMGSLDREDIQAKLAAMGLSDGPTHG